MAILPRTRGAKRWLRCWFWKMGIVTQVQHVTTFFFHHTLELSETSMQVVWISFLVRQWLPWSQQKSAGVGALRALRASAWLPPQWGGRSVGLSLHWQSPASWTPQSDPATVPWDHGKKHWEVVSNLQFWMLNSVQPECYFEIYFIFPVSTRNYLWLGAASWLWNILIQSTIVRDEEQPKQSPSGYD